MLYAEIVVDSYQDPAKRLFTYRVPENLLNSVKEGGRVTIPFGKRFVEGFVWSMSRTKPPFPTKDIQTTKGVAFSKTQVELAKWMAARYLASPRDCLRCQTGEKGAKTAAGPAENITTLLLVPYAAQVKLHALTEKQKNALVGSRSAVFAQIPNLKKIIIEEPENWNYKDERAPYYHAAEVAQKRAELEGLEIELKYQIPRAEDVQAGATIPKIKPVQIIDLNREKSAGNFTFISQPLEDILALKRLTIVYVTSKEIREEIAYNFLKIGADKNIVKIAGPGETGFACLCRIGHSVRCSWGTILLRLYGRRRKTESDRDGRGEVRVLGERASYR